MSGRIIPREAADLVRLWEALLTRYQQPWAAVLCRHHTSSPPQFDMRERSRPTGSLRILSVVMITSRAWNR